MDTVNFLSIYEQLQSDTCQSIIHLVLIQSDLWTEALNRMFCMLW